MVLRNFIMIKVGFRVLTVWSKTGMFCSAPCFGVTGRYGFYIRKTCSVFTKIIRALNPSKIVMQAEVFSASYLSPCTRYTTWQT